MVKFVTFGPGHILTSKWKLNSSNGNFELFVKLKIQSSIQKKRDDLGLGKISCRFYKLSKIRDYLHIHNL